jgi:hypothetical protein
MFSVSLSLQANNLKETKAAYSSFLSDSPTLVCIIPFYPTAAVNKKVCFDKNIFVVILFMF